MNLLLNPHFTVREHPKPLTFPQLFARMSRDEPCTFTNLRANETASNAAERFPATALPSLHPGPSATAPLPRPDPRNSAARELPSFAQQLGLPCAMLSTSHRKSQHAPLPVPDLMQLRPVLPDGTRLDPLHAPFIKLPAPSDALTPQTPCRIVIVHPGKRGYYPTDLSAPDTRHAQSTYDEANHRMGWSNQGIWSVVARSLGTEH